MSPVFPRGLLLYLSLTSVVLLCVFPSLLPWHHFPLTSFYSEWLAFALGLGVMAVLLDRRAWISAEVPWIALSPFALSLLVIMHGALGWSPYFGHALIGALYLVWAGLLIIAARALTRICGMEVVFTVVAASLAAGALLNAAIGVIQYFNVITPLNAFIVRLHSAAIFGNLAQSNHYAACITLGLLSLGYLYGRARLPLPVMIFCSLPLLFVLGVSGSRSPWLYLLMAFSAAIWLRLVSENHDRAAQRLFFSTGVFLILHYAMQTAVGAGWFKPPEHAAITAIDRLFSGAESVGVRLGLWSAAWSIALDHPVFGAGWGTFAEQYFDFIARPGVAVSHGLFNNAHNIVLQLFAETGVVGLILLLLPFTAWFFSMLRIRPDVHQWWLLGTLGVFGIHSMLEYPLWYAYFLGVAAVLLGLGGGPVFVPKLARLGRIFATAAVIVGAYNLAFIWLDHRQFEEVTGPPSAQSRSLDIPALMARLHQNALLAPYIELFSAIPLEVEEENLSGRLLLMEQVTRFTPMPVLVYKHVLLLALADRASDAQARLAEVRCAYPDRPAEFDRRLQRLVGEYPERFRPLLESTAYIHGCR